MALVHRLSGPDRQSSRHRNVEGGSFRAAVLGAGDGLITNVSLVLGVAGANPGGATVRLAGVAGLLAGAFSMAAGELVSVRAQHELVQREIAVERDELVADPEGEEVELAAMYRARGLGHDDATTVARIMSTSPELALDTHTRMELGINPDRESNAARVAATSFVAFALGAVLPLLPWFFLAGAAAVATSVAIGAAAALALGAVIGSFSGRGAGVVALRQLAAIVVSAGVTYAVGLLIGVGVA